MVTVVESPFYGRFRQCSGARGCDDRLESPSGDGFILFAFGLLSTIYISGEKEYFTGKGIVGSLQRFFFTSVGQVPIDRKAKGAGGALVDTAKSVFARGDLLGIYPEGTRSPDGRVYRGRTGMARIAMETDVPVIPVAMINVAKANPIGTWIPRPVKVGVRFGTPVSPHEWARNRGLDPKEHQTMREFTDFIMHELAELTGVEYVDHYASEVKESLAAGNGYPEGAEPNQT